ncbi:MAG: glycosyltransferase family 2 protein [Nitrososphaeria archaeon]
MLSNLPLQEKKISIFIPVYVNSELLDSLLEELLKDNYENKEIFVIIDNPNQDSLNLFEKYKNKVFFILNNQRIGKANALNDAVNYSNGHILLFLDSDIKLENDGTFLSKVVNEMHEADILDIKKDIIRDSFVSKMVNYEYISSNFVSYLYSRFARRSVGINGAAFAIKREVFKEVGGFSKVVSEDFDLAIKVALKDRCFKFYGRSEVKTKSPRNWKDWFIQRKRWGIGVGLWLKDHWFELLKYVRKYPHLALLSFVILFPTFIPILLSYFLSNFLGYKLINFIVMFLATKFPLLIAFPFIFSISLLILTSFMNFIISFILFLILYFLFAKKLNFSFSVLEFTIYYFFYQPFAFFVLIIGIITPFVYKKYKLDWKI